MLKPNQLRDYPVTLAAKSNVYGVFIDNFLNLCGISSHENRSRVTELLKSLKFRKR